MDGVLYNAINGVKKALKLKALDGTTDTTAQAMLDEWGADAGEGGSMDAALADFKSAIDGTLFAEGGLLANNSAVKSIQTGEVTIAQTSGTSATTAQTWTFPAAINVDKALVFVRLPKTYAINIRPYILGASYTYALFSEAITITPDFAFTESGRSTELEITVVEFY